MTGFRIVVAAGATIVAVSAGYFADTTPSNAQMRAADDQGPRPIMGTQTMPLYPAISRRLGEQGTSGLQLSISADGFVTDCRITKSSGAERLDAAACDYVAEHWRYQPATHKGMPIASSDSTEIVWNLHGVSKK